MRLKWYLAYGVVTGTKCNNAVSQYIKLKKWAIIIIIIIHKFSNPEEKENSLIVE